jgi:hypothetical protein
MGWYKLDPVVREKILRLCRVLDLEKEIQIDPRWMYPSRRFWPLEHSPGEAEFERGLWRQATK